MRVKNITNVASPRTRSSTSRGAKALADGAVVAYPTEAVFGLGCDPWNPRAVRRLLALKRRPEHKGLIVIASNIEQLDCFVAPVQASLRLALEATWPGPVTWVLRARRGIPRWLRGSHRGIAVRVTAHPVAAALCRRFGGAIVSTSANRAGHPACHDAACVARVFGAALPVIVHGSVGGDPRPTIIMDGVSGTLLRD